MKGVITSLQNRELLSALDIWPHVQDVAADASETTAVAIIFDVSSGLHYLPLKELPPNVEDWDSQLIAQFIASFERGEIEATDFLEDMWFAAVTADGATYYYNSKGATTWEKPSGYVEDSLSVNDDGNSNTDSACNNDLHESVVLLPSKNNDEASLEAALQLDSIERCIFVCLATEVTTETWDANIIIKSANALAHSEPQFREPGLRWFVIPCDNKFLVSMLELEDVYVLNALCCHSCQRCHCR